MYDILVFYKDCKQYTARIKKKLASLATSYLLLKPSKCELYQEEVSLLGNVVLCDAHAKCPEKTKAILEFERPEERRRSAPPGIGEFPPQNLQKHLR